MGGGSMGANSNIEGSGMPSFSRTGRNSSNRNELATVNRCFERTRAADARERPAFKYQSLADKAPRADDYAADLGRGALIASSPRLDGVPSEKKAKDGLAFQRIVRWSSVPGQDYNPHELHDVAKPAGRGAHEDKIKAPQKERPNHFFVATERGAPNDYLEVFNKQVGQLAPPIGYYNAKLDLTKPAGPKLGYIVQVDRPHAPSFMAETLVNETLAKSKKELTLQGKAPKQPVSVTPRTAVRLLRDKSPNVTDLSQYSVLNTSHHKSPKKEKEIQAPQPKQEDQEERAQTAASPDKEALMSPMSPNSKLRPRTSSPTTGTRIFDKRWDASHITIDMDGRTARTKASGQSTCTGHQMMTPQSADVWYRPSFEVMEVSCRHVPTPDLSRSGKDYDDRILRLGFQLPETLAQAPFYPAVVSAMDWSAMPKWYAATTLMDNNTMVQIGKQTARRSIAMSGPDTGLRIQYRHPTRDSTSTVARQHHPTLPHVPGPDLKRSTSAHGDIAAFKSITMQLNYHPSNRLLTNRTTHVLRLKKMCSRRPLTAHPYTGKPNQEISDIVYDTHYAEMEIVRPRTRSPVDMQKRVGREGWGGISGESSAGGLTGFNYWDGVDNCTSSLRKLDKVNLPNLDRTQGREAVNPRDVADREALFFASTIDAEIKPPISKVGNHHFKTGNMTGSLWHPKDNVMGTHVMAPNLDENSREQEATRAKKNRSLTKDLNYNVDDTILRKRVHTPIISSKPFNPLGST